MDPGLWLRSTAKASLTLQEQGAYRNLYDAMCLDLGRLPFDENFLKYRCGDPASWEKVRTAVLGLFKLVSDRDGTWYMAKPLVAKENILPFDSKGES